MPLSSTSGLETVSLGIVIFYLFFNLFCPWTATHCYIKELISCQEIKNYFILCVYLLLSFGDTHRHTLTFKLPLCCKPVWNRISCRLCLVQQAYTYFSPSQNAAEPLILNARHIVNTYTKTHTRTDISSSCYVLLSSASQPQSVRFISSSQHEKVSVGMGLETARSREK